MGARQMSRGPSGRPLIQSPLSGHILGARHCAEPFFPHKRFPPYSFSLTISALGLRDQKSLSRVARPVNGKAGI